MKYFAKYARCKNCKNWYPQSQSWEMGKCQKIRLVDNTFKYKSLDVLRASKDNDVMTGANFGCIHFTSRESYPHPVTLAEPRRMSVAELKLIFKEIGQAGLARRLGMSRQGVNSWLKDNRGVSAGAAIAIRALGLNNPDILREEERRDKVAKAKRRTKEADAKRFSTVA